MKKNNPKDKNTNAEGREMYESFVELAELKKLYTTDKPAYQKMADEWDIEYRRQIKSIIQDTSFQDLGDGMTVVLQDDRGWDKPRFLLDDKQKTGVEFMDGSFHLLTVKQEDIDWKSLKGMPENVIRMAKALSGYYPVLIPRYERGRAEVIWTLNPNGMYYMDEDGYGMEADDDDVEVKLIGYIDRNGQVVRKFSYYG